MAKSELKKPEIVHTPKTLSHKLHKRLRFIEGQAQGVRAMAENGREPADIIVQLLAIQSAARAAIDLIAREQMAQQIRESVQRAVLTCVGECAVCDDPEVLEAALEQVDYEGVLENIINFKRSHS